MKHFEHFQIDLLIVAFDQIIQIKFPILRAHFIKNHPPAQGNRRWVKSNPGLVENFFWNFFESSQGSLHSGSGQKKSSKSLRLGSSNSKFHKPFLGKLVGSRQSSSPDGRNQNYN